MKQYCDPNELCAVNWNQNSRCIILLSTSRPSVTWLQLGRREPQIPQNKYIYGMWCKGRGKVIHVQLVASCYTDRAVASLNYIFVACSRAQICWGIIQLIKNLLGFIEYKKSAPSSQKHIGLCQYICLLSVKAQDKFTYPCVACIISGGSAHRVARVESRLWPLCTQTNGTHSACYWSLTKPIVHCTSCKPFTERHMANCKSSYPETYRFLIHTSYRLMYFTLISVL